MVIEHTFVTTLDAEPTMQASMQFLRANGYARPGQAAFPLSGQWNTLEMRRGKKKPRKAKNICQLPQTAHVQFDRGRVVIALTIEPSYVWGGGSSGFFSFGSVEGNPKKMKLHAQLLTAIATGLEQLLTCGATVEQASAPIVPIEDECRRRGRRRRIRIWTIAIIFILICAGLVTLAAVKG